MVPVLHTGCRSFLFTFNPLFSSLYLVLYPSCGTFVQARHSFFAFSMVEELTPFSFHFSRSVQEQYLHDLTQARSPFVNLSSYPHQNIQPALIKPLVPSFLKISLPLRSFFPLFAGASLPFVVSSFPLFLPFPLFLLFLLLALVRPHFWLCAKKWTMF